MQVEIVPKKILFWREMHIDIRRYSEKCQFEYQVYLYTVQVKSASLRPWKMLLVNSPIGINNKRDTSGVLKLTT